MRNIHERYPLIYPQSRGQWSKGLWYIRQFIRELYAWFEYGANGGVQQMALSGMIFAGLGAFFLFSFYVSFLLIRAVFLSFFESDESEDGQLSSTTTKTHLSSKKED